jgi:hypothetical protein
MALIKCKDCGKEVSSKAKVCPNCGRAVPKRTSLITWLFAGLICFVALSAIFGGRGSQSIAPAATTAASAAAPAGAAPEKKPDPDIDAALRVGNLVLNLRAAARNPDSFRLTKAYRMKNGAACIEYRAQNGFGGLNVGKALAIGTQFKTNETEGFAGAWNHYCVGTGIDIKPGVRRAFELAGQCRGCVQDTDQ